LRFVLTAALAYNSVFRNSGTATPFRLSYQTQ
jgi:hypothetical protein